MQDFQPALVRRGAQERLRAGRLSFWLLTARSMQYAWGGNVGLQMIHEVADNIAGRVADHQCGQRANSASPTATRSRSRRRSARCRAVPCARACGRTPCWRSASSAWATPLAKDFGVPSLNALAGMSLDLTDATGSGADLVRARAQGEGGRMTRWAMIADLRRCVGCRTCTAACKHANATPPGVQWRRVLDVETGEFPDVQRAFIPIGCQHCDEPACLPVCPTTATRKRADGIVTIDYDLCIGCAYCTMACPYQARSKSPACSPTADADGERGAPRRPRRSARWRPSAPSAWTASTRASRKGLLPGRDPEATPACVNACIARRWPSATSGDSNVSQLLALQRALPPERGAGHGPGFYYLWDRKRP